jgi:mRNA interferase YafQ
VAKNKPKAPSVPPPPPEPLVAILTKQFKRDVARQEKRGKDLAKLEAIIESLRHHGTLDPKHRDHALSGRFKTLRDCHVEPNWVLIYTRLPGQLILFRTGKHDELKLE